MQDNSDCLYDPNLLNAIGLTMLFLIYTLYCLNEMRIWPSIVTSIVRNIHSEVSMVAIVQSVFLEVVTQCSAVRGCQRFV
jgi:hypothetical protein